MSSGPSPASSDYGLLIGRGASPMELALATRSFEACSPSEVPVDRAAAAYGCWLAALDFLHPGHGFRRFGLTDAERGDAALLERLLSSVLFDVDARRFVRSVIAMVNGYRRDHHG